MSIVWVPSAAADRLFVTLSQQTSVLKSLPRFDHATWGLFQFYLASRPQKRHRAYRGRYVETDFRSAFYHTLSVCNTSSASAERNGICISEALSMFSVQRAWHLIVLFADVRAKEDVMCQSECSSYFVSKEGSFLTCRNWDKTNSNSKALFKQESTHPALISTQKCHTNTTKT